MTSTVPKTTKSKKRSKSVDEIEETSENASVKHSSKKQKLQMTMEHV